MGELIADIFDELVLQGHTRVPDFLVRNIIDGMPDVLITLVAHETLVEIFIIHLAPFGRRPCRQVNTVGDITHTVFLREIPLPQRSEHLLAHPTMKFRHTVDFLRCVARERTHAETLTVIFGIGTPHADKLIPRDAQLGGICAHVFAEKLLIEVVVACRNWCVNGVD